MTSFEKLTRTIYEKLLVIDTKYPQFSFSELKDIANHNRYPRIEIDLIKFKSNGYLDQRNLQWTLYYRIVGYLKDPSVVREDGNILYDRLIEEKLEIVDYGLRTVNRVYSLLDDKQNGLIDLPGFIKFGSFPEIWTDSELMPGLASFAFQLEAELILLDTEE
jgi:hypothetical protein